MHVPTAGLLALGSLLQATFPVSQWYVGRWLADYSCGGSRGLGHSRPFTVFPFEPHGGTVACLIGVGRLDDKGFAAHCDCMATANDDQARHKAKMANHKAVQDQEVDGKTFERGLLIVHTGKGECR